jgi:LCP family protein required for cell wall assembly
LLRSGRLIGRTIAALVSATLVIYIGYLWSQVHNIDNGVTHLAIPSIDDPTGQSGGSATQDIDGQDQNLLIVGNDDRTGMTPAEINLLRTGGGDGSLSTDTMMIVHVPADGSKATLISLPRDSYVAIPGYGMNKLNAAYAFGYRDSGGSHKAKVAAGADLLIRTVQNLTQLHIDHFVEVGLIGFYRIANAIGPIPVTLCHAVDDTAAHNAAEGQDGGSGFKMSAGFHKLNAVQALEFVRQRHNFPLGDLQRVERQRYFLTAAFRKVASAGILLNPGELGNLVKAVDTSLYVDQGLKLLDLAKQMSNLSANNIVGKTIPYVRDDPDTSAGDALIVDPAQVQRFVRSVIAGSTTSSAYTSAKPVAPSTVSVTVLNAGTQNGAATTATGVLKNVGFQATVGSAEPSQQDITTIEYPKGSESQAKTLAEYVPGAQVQEANVSSVTLTLGSDGLTAHSSPSTPAKPKPHKAIDAGCIN